ncbi:MAG: VOC family protein [Bryobacterales bacterium]|nr:VOC family protein [Bryobacterales bacterium]
MAKVIGVGGVFIKSPDPAALREWYQKVLGFEMEPWGGAVFPPGPAAAVPGAGTVWCPFKPSTTYFAPSTREVMVNFMVDDMDAMLERCRANGVEVKEAEPQNGRFAHLMDPDGTRIELWEPKP